MIQINKTYYNQQDIAKLLADEIDYTKDEMVEVLNSLGDIIKSEFSTHQNIEIKLFSGLKLSCKLIQAEDNGKGFCASDSIQSKTYAFIKGIFSDAFKKEIKKRHCVCLS